jgi:cobyrinic acid a,c-diamide synthase
MSGIYLSAAHKSSGKTTVTLGLCRALTRLDLCVQPYKKGPDYIDPIWHSQAARRPCYNLDFNLMSGAEIDSLHARGQSDADIALVEGNKGLYDGMDLLGSNSNAALAKRLGLPVVLVIDTTGMTRGIAPLLLGYQAFDAEVSIAGVILNKVGGPRHEAKLRDVVAHYTDIPVIGAVHKSPALAIVERHLGLIPGNEVAGAEARIDAIADVVAAGVDLDALRAIAARAAPPARQVEPPAAPGPADRVRLGIAQDRVFGFYYQEDLDTLRATGAELVPIDTLADAALPEIDGLLIGGGFPEAFIGELAGNARLMADIRRQAEAGLPIYAECGGLMYLSRSLRWGDIQGAMVGLVPGDTVMGERPVGRGYASLRQLRPGPLGEPVGAEIAAHEFHYSRLENLAPGLDYTYAVTRGQGMDGSHDGYARGNLIAEYCHRRGSGPRGWIAPFVELARQRARQRRATRLAA